MSSEPTKIFDGEQEKGDAEEGEFPFDPDAEEKEAAVSTTTAQSNAEPAAASEPEAEGSGKRDYVIFKEIDKDTFKKIAVVNSATSDGAIESLGEDGLEDGATYTAPPARFWNPKPAKVEKTTTITLG